MNALERFLSRHPAYYGYLKGAVIVGGVLLGVGFGLAIYSVIAPGAGP